MDQSVIENALKIELERMKELKLSAIERTHYISTLKKKINSLPIVKKFDFDLENNIPKVTYKGADEWPVKFSLDIGGTHGLGLYPNTEILKGNQRLISNIFIGSPPSHSFKMKYYVPKSNDVDFSAYFNPGFYFGYSSSRFDVKKQDVKKQKYSFAILNEASTIKLFYRHMKMGSSPKAEPDICILPFYSVYGAKFNFIKDNMENICYVGICKSNWAIQPFISQQSFYRLKLNDTLSADFNSGFIFSHGTLPVLERFYRIAPYITSSVKSTGFGISNGSFIAACDCYAAADILAQFDAGPWEISCFSKMVIAGLSKPDLPLEQPGVAFHSFCGFSVGIALLKWTPSLTIYYPIYSPSYIKTIPFLFALN